MIDDGWTTELEGFALPAGWLARRLDQRLYSGELAEIRASVGGEFRASVTVDFTNRGFRGGLVTRGRMDSDGTYAGRGWRQALVAAAVKGLDSVIKS